MEQPVRGKTVNVAIRKVGAKGVSNTFDEIVTEEPLEIRVYLVGPDGKERYDSISVTMRTPGNDFELAAGFLYSEGVISSRDDVERISYCVNVSEEQQYNIVNVYLGESAKFDPDSLLRHFYATSSCGVCGKASLEAIRTKGFTPIADDATSVSPETVVRLPDELRKAQLVFDKTGGLHASGLFDVEGRLELLREDVGRHNALDKLIGSQLLAGKVPIRRRICVVSGRIGFELVQKSLAAGIPLIAGVGAPSSLAVDLAREFNMTLIGFIRQGGFNIYSGGERVSAPQVAAPSTRTE
jgi:FdhD protein